jgi:hypothetical protein
MSNLAEPLRLASSQLQASDKNLGGHCCGKSPTQRSTRNENGRQHLMWPVNEHGRKLARLDVTMKPSGYRFSSSRVPRSRHSAVCC